MGRCYYCNEKIKPGEDLILEGEYPRRRLVTALLVRVELNRCGPLYHRTCFLKMLAKESRTETVASPISKNFLKRYSEKMQK